jgi:hypothetical protein
VLQSGTVFVVTDKKAANRAASSVLADPCLQQRRG